MSKRIISKRMVIMLISVAVLFGLVFGFKAFRSHMITQFLDNLPQPPATISTYKAHQDNWALTLNAVGTVNAVNGVEVTTQVGGEVQSIRFKSGDTVKKGDTLIVLESAADQAQLQALEATARLAEQEFGRYQSLYKRGSISRSELDTRRAQRDQAMAQAQAQRAQLGYKTVRAPFDGVLGIRKVDLGEYLQPGTPVVTLAQLAPIYVNFSLPQQNFSQIQDGLEVHATLDAYPDETFAGTVTAIESGVEQATRNFTAQATFDNGGHKLRPGMFAHVEVRLPQSSEVVVIPRTAISYAPYGDTIYVVEDAPKGKDQKSDKIVKKRFVKLGMQRGDLIAVLKGLKPGEVVATSGLLKLRNDAPVVIDNQVQPEASAHPHPDNS